MADMNIGSVKNIASVVLTLVVLAGISVLLVSVLLGSGSSAATALGVGAETSVTNANTALSNTATVQGTLFGFLPWLGVGLAVIGALGLRKVI